MILLAKKQSYSCLSPLHSASVKLAFLFGCFPGNRFKHNSINHVEL